MKNKNLEEIIYGCCNSYLSSFTKDYQIKHIEKNEFKRFIECWVEHNITDLQGDSKIYEPGKVAGLDNGFKDGYETAINILNIVGHLQIAMILKDLAPYIDYKKFEKIRKSNDD
jgi:hypothetical protein